MLLYVHFMKSEPIHLLGKFLYDRIKFRGIISNLGERVLYFLCGTLYHLDTVQTMSFTLTVTEMNLHLVDRIERSKRPYS